jgi:hypothetical protein
MSDDYPITGGVPLPGRMIKYKFATMEIGDSFPVKREDLRKVRAAASAYGRAHDKRFSVRLINPSAKTYRCWRIADKREDE